MSLKINDLILRFLYCNGVNDANLLTNLCSLFSRGPLFKCGNGPASLNLPTGIFYGWHRFRCNYQGDCDMKSMWKGSIGFGLVNIPVRLYVATDESTISFVQLDKKTHGRVKYKKV